MRRRGGDLVDGLLERGGVVRRRGAEPADLPDVLQRGRPDILVGHLLSVRRAQGLNAPAHGPERTGSTLTSQRDEVNGPLPSKDEVNGPLPSYRPGWLPSRRPHEPRETRGGCSIEAQEGLNAYCEAGGEGLYAADG